MRPFHLSRLLASLLVALLLGAGVFAQSFEEAHKQAVDDLVPRLLKVAAWCHSKGLYVERDALYTLVIDYRPEDRRARAALKFKKSRKKGWYRSSSYKPPKNRKNSEKYLAELTAMRELEFGSFRDTLLKQIEEGGDALPLAQREQVLGEIVTLHPFHKQAHLLLGEEYELGRWWLAETVRARERRARLRALADQCLAQVTEAEVVKVTDQEKALGVSFVGGLRSHRVRILSTVGADEMARVFKLVEAAWPFLEKTLGVEPYWVKGFTIYTLNGKDEAAKVFAKHPKATDRQRALARRVGGMWIDSRYMVQYHPHHDRRQESVLRQSLGMQFAAHFRITSDQAWAWEGLGLHLTWLLRGTRNTSFVKPGSYDMPETDWPDLTKPDTDWLRVARQLLESDKKPNLHSVLHKKVNDLTVPDLLYGYALAVYLFESRHEQLVKLLTHLGKDSMVPEEAVQKVLGWDLGTLERRLIRWLREMET